MSLHELLKRILARNRRWAGRSIPSDITAILQDERHLAPFRWNTTGLCPTNGRAMLVNFLQFCGIVPIQFRHIRSSSARIHGILGGCGAWAAVRRLPFRQKEQRGDHHDARIDRR